MSEILCLNLCEIVNGLFLEKQLETTLDDILFEVGLNNCERVYIGSYFCSQFFLNLKLNHIEELIYICNKRNMKISLVIPTFSQKDLERGKDKIKILCNYIGNVIDEITVNDYGMLAYISMTYKVSINLGRLFMKDYRDPRHSVYFHQNYKPKILSDFLLDLIKSYQVVGLEFDLTHELVDLSGYPKELKVGYHSPYSYMTMGNICELGSINKKMNEKFRPNGECNLECMTHSIEYFFDDDRKWYRIGRTIYFNNEDCNIIGFTNLRKIYSPLDNLFSLLG